MHLPSAREDGRAASFGSIRYRSNDFFVVGRSPVNRNDKILVRSEEHYVRLLFGTHF